MYQLGTATGEVPRRHDGGHPHRRAEREQLLVDHLAGHRLPVEAPPLREEEVAGVDDLLHLAARLPQWLADLARDQPGERLGVLLDEPPELLDRATAHRSRGSSPAGLCLARDTTAVEERVGVTERGLAERVV